MSQVWSENRTSAGRAAAAGGGSSSVLGGGRVSWLGGWSSPVSGRGRGLDGDLVAEAFQAADVVAGLAADVRRRS